MLGLLRTSSSRAPRCSYTYRVTGTSRVLGPYDYGPSGNLQCNNTSENLLRHALSPRSLLVAGASVMGRPFIPFVPRMIKFGLRAMRGSRPRAARFGSSEYQSAYYQVLTPRLDVSGRQTARPGLGLEPLQLHNSGAVSFLIPNIQHFKVDTGFNSGPGF